ncbi:hypothetical protein FZEAL_7499 [Fusarium zealandicum]|uniref:Uncharacterized protein n=1 Tax=Fusarium zealandicum TaxID=1053134 RepID=A0A8H4UGH8_9HYPO|nr:hypothetical protein FZEAL_7499 [Fusarium zealandicum]
MLLSGNGFIKRIYAALWLASEARKAGGLPISEVDFGDMLSHVDCLGRYMQTRQDLVDTAFQLLPTLPRSVMLCSAGHDSPEYLLLLQRYSLPCFTAGWQRMLSTEFPHPTVEEGGGQQRSHEANRHQRHATVSFAGDAVDLVPFGWTDALSGRIIHWYGEAFYEHPEREGEDWLDGDDAVFRSSYIHRLIDLNLWRGAGFASWDRGRVEAMKMLDQLGFLRTGWIVQQVVLPRERA